MGLTFFADMTLLSQKQGRYLQERIGLDQRFMLVSGWYYYFWQEDLRIKQEQGLNSVWWYQRDPRFFSYHIRWDGFLNLDQTTQEASHCQQLRYLLFTLHLDCQSQTYSILGLVDRKFDWLPPILYHKDLLSRFHCTSKSCQHSQAYQTYRPQLLLNRVYF